MGPKAPYSFYKIPTLDPVLSSPHPQHKYPKYLFKNNLQLHFFLTDRITGCFGLLPSSGILETRKHNVPKTGSVSVVRWVQEPNSSVCYALSSEPFRIYFFLMAFVFANSENTAIHKTVPERFKEQNSPFVISEGGVSSYQGTNLSQNCYTK
jgi:hypothetical protein